MQNVQQLCVFVCTGKTCKRCVTEKVSTFHHRGSRQMTLKFSVDIDENPNNNSIRNSFRKKSFHFLNINWFSIHHELTLKKSMSPVFPLAALWTAFSLSIKIFSARRSGDVAKKNCRRLTDQSSSGKEHENMTARKKRVALNYNEIIIWKRRAYRCWRGRGREFFLADENAIMFFSVMKCFQKTRTHTENLSENHKCSSSKAPKLSHETEKFPFHPLRRVVGKSILKIIPNEFSQFLKEKHTKIKMQNNTQPKMVGGARQEKTQAHFSVAFFHPPNFSPPYFFPYIFFYPFPNGGEKSEKELMKK